MIDWEHIITAASTLFLVLDPPGNAPVVQGLLQTVEPKRRDRVLIRELLFVLALLMLFFFLGQPILDWLGISRSTLNLSGGIMLFLIAVGMVFPHVDVASPKMKPNMHEPFIVPVAVPLIMGPAAISLVVMQAAMCTNQSQMFGGLIAIILAWAATSIILYFASKVLSFLGDKGAVALTRLMGTLLVLLAVQMILDGVTDYIQHLQPVLPQ